jgi:hypothetical protein
MQDFGRAMAEECLAILPVSRVLIDEAVRIGPFHLYPADGVDLSELRTIPNRAARSAHGPLVSVLEGQDLRESLSHATGATVETLRQNTLLAFPIRLDWGAFLCADHKQDIDLLSRLSSHASRAIDVIRFHFCHFHLPDSLPGQPGTWNGSGPHCAALLYSCPDHESYLIAGPAVMSSVVVRGMGLELEAATLGIDARLPGSGEVGRIASHALSLYSAVLEANSWTSKYARAFTLIEFLATPDEYRVMQKAKTDILVHVANSKTEYHRLCARFRDLTSRLDDTTGEQRGIRTLITHHGRQLEDLLPSERDRVALMQELQQYCSRVLADMLRMSDETWEAFVEYRDERAARIGIDRTAIHPCCPPA